MKPFINCTANVICKQISLSYDYFFPPSSTIHACVRHSDEARQRNTTSSEHMYKKKKELHDFEESFTCYHAVMVIWDASLGANVSERKSKSLHPRPAPWLLNRNLKIDLYFLIHLQIKRITKRQTHIQKGTYKSVKKISLGFCSFDHNN